MLSDTVKILSASNESFQDQEDKSRTVEYVDLVLMIGTEIVPCTGKMGVLEQLNGELARVEAGDPVTVRAEFLLRPNRQGGKTCRPQVVKFESVSAGE